MKASIPLFILILPVFLMLASGCAADPPTPPAPPAPADESPITGEWVADGVIEPGEYRYRQALSDSMELHWTTTNETIQIGLAGRASGWIGIGLGTPRMMAGVDYLAGYVDGETAIVQDLFSENPRCPIRMDTEIGGTDDILRSGGRQADGVTTIECERLFTTGDEYDYEIRTNEEIAIIWALSESNSMTVPHRERGSTTIILRR